MEPQLPAPIHSPENGPAQFAGGEVFDGKKQPEKAPEQQRSGETREIRHDDPTGEPVAAQPVAPPPLPTIDAVVQPTTSTQPADDTPLVADDNDLIEKEWVEKAKKVVNMTQHDPYMQEKAVSKLQADYLQKRYGKSVKLPSDG